MGTEGSPGTGENSLSSVDRSNRGLECVLGSCSFKAGSTTLAIVPDARL